MEQVWNHLVALAGAIGLMALAHFGWVISGFGNKRIKNKNGKWSWSRFLDDLIVLGCFSVSMFILVVTLDFSAYYIQMLEIEAFDTIMNTLSYGAIIVVPLAATYYLDFRALKNNKSIAQYDKAIQTLGIDDSNGIKYTDNTDQIAKNITDAIQNIVDLYVPKDLANRHLEFEEKGGRGAYYSVDITSYDTFRAATLGKGFDVDNAYSYQCWDLCAVVWQQLGLSLLTGNGCAYGCWTLKRDVNAGNNFTLIVNKKDVKRGDVVVFGGGQFGHIGLADEDYNGGAYIRLLGQNQGGEPGPDGVGAKTNVINVSMAGFLGAFRYKKWANNSTPVAPEKKPEPTPTTPTAEHDGFSIGDKVVPTKLVDAFGTKLRQYDDYYIITGWREDVNGAILSARGTIWAVMSLGSFKKA